MRGLTLNNGLACCTRSRQFAAPVPLALRQPAGARHSQRQHTVARASSVSIPDRLASFGPYLLPLLDGLRYGKFLFMQFPIFQKVLLPITPLAELYFSNQFIPIAGFFAVYIGIVNNTGLNRQVRFNAMQALLLDILLILPSVVESIIKAPQGGPLVQLYITGYNTIFLFIFVACAYGMGSALAGVVPRIPLVADAADQQVR